MMKKKKEKQEKEPNLKASLLASIFFLVVINWCLADAIRDKIYGNSIMSYLILGFFILCDIGMVWLTVYVLKRIKEEKKP